MKKFPFSKKAINIMIATALVVTPVASLAPIGTNFSGVEASTLPAGTLESLLELKTYYDGLTDAQETIIDEHRALLSQLNATDWSTILGGLEADINSNLTVPNTATGMMADLANIFLQTNYTDVVNEVIAFQGKYDADFNAAFGVNFIDYLAFYANIHDNVKASYNQSTIEAAIGSSLTDFMVTEARKVSNYSTLSSSVKAAIGEEYTIASLVQIKFDLMDTISSKNSSNYAPGTLKDTLIAALKNNLSSGLTGGGTLPADDTTTVDKVTNPDGTTTVVVTVDTNKLKESLNNQTSVEKVSFKVEKAAGETGEAKIPAAAFDVVKEKNPNAKIEIVSTEGTLRLPVSEIKIDDVAKSLGVAAADVTISIKINAVTETQQAIIKNNLKVKSDVVEFKIVASSDDNTKEVNFFSEYLERELVGSANFNAANSTVVRLNDDGTFTAVPTVIEGNKAIFKNFSNSKYTVVENETTFSDVASDYWAKATIDKLGSKYIVQGKLNGDFEPKATTTRAEFATLLTRSLGLSTDASYDNQFSDVKGTEWFVDDLVAAVQAGLIKGHANGTFGYNDAVTREEAAVMIHRALKLVKFDDSSIPAADLSQFDDVENISTWAKNSVETLLKLEVTKGRPDGFAPKAGTQRAEMATLIERFLVKVNFMN